MAPTREDRTRILRRGWTTGACATAAAKAAFAAILTGEFPDPEDITQPKGERPEFALAVEEKGTNWAHAGIVKDAGDDPDVTHGALIVAKVTLTTAGSGVTFKAGPGVGEVTKAGLPIMPGEPAINPVPRRMMTEVIAELAELHDVGGDVEIEISVRNGAELAKRTWNPRLGIVGGLSILGTTGVVHPFSCSAWIHSIHRGIDVARAEGLTHLAGATGSTSEAVVQKLHGLPNQALIDMGDFAGGMLKYLRRNPVPRITIGGGFAKMTKLGQGMLDLHSGRSQVDFDWLAARLAELGASSALQSGARAANTALEVLQAAESENLPLGASIAEQARAAAQATLRDAAIAVDTVVVDRQGRIIGQAAREV